MSEQSNHLSKMREGAAKAEARIAEIYDRFIASRLASEDTQESDHEPEVALLVDESLEIDPQCLSLEEESERLES